MEAEQHLGLMKTADEAQETLQRSLLHLEENGIDLSAIDLTIGPQLALEPKSETIRDHKLANAMLTRDYRAPFIVPPEGQV